MKRTAIDLSLGLVAGLPTVAVAQAGHDVHHPAQAQEQAIPPATPTMPMPGMPEQCRTMMQAMPAECMSAMQQMMQGGMMHGAADASKAAGTASAASCIIPPCIIYCMAVMHSAGMACIMVRIWSGIPGIGIVEAAGGAACSCA